MRSFSLFQKAFLATRREIRESIKILILVTIIFAVTMYIAEHSKNPDFSFWDSLIWTFVKYVEDPADIVDAPVTLVGKIVGTLVGVLGIAIFAVPAGLIGSGLMDAMAEEKREKELEEYRGRMRKAFRRVLNKNTQYRVTARRLPVITLQAKKGMSEKDIIDTASKFDEFRLRNLATSQIERTSYGIKINRGSLVTIIAPTAATENSIGHFAYYLAQFGGFNYVSREFVTDVDEPVSYYTIEGKEDEWEQPLKDFVHDIKSFSASDEKWNVVLISSDNVYDTQFHFVHRANEKSGLASTTLDEEKFAALYSDFAAKMQEGFGYLSDSDEKYRPVGKKNVGIITGGGAVNNAFTLRISYSVTTWSDSPAPVIVEMAKVLKSQLEKPERSQFKEEDSWKKKGCGYGENG
jgi:voltage-gated potassium channel